MLVKDITVLKSSNREPIERMYYMVKITSIILSILLITFGFGSANAKAHGVEIDYQETRSIEITARFDNGDPIQEGNVSIFSPENQQSPWQDGVTDTEGKYLFAPDSSINGNWTIIVRQAGHGASANVVIDQHELTAGTTGLSPLQIVIMLACIIWGTIGTSLYFKGRKNHAHT